MLYVGALVGQLLLFKDFVWRKLHKKADASSASAFLCSPALPFFDAGNAHDTWPTVYADHTCELRHNDLRAGVDRCELSC